MPAVQLTLTLCLLLAASRAYSVQGEWQLENGKGITEGRYPLTLTISDFVFRSENILQRLSFQECQEMLLQSSFTENQLFINFGSYFTQPIETRSCPQGGNSPLDQIYAALNTVFYFQIDGKKMMFNDPYGQDVLTFKRVVKPKATNLVGIWSMNQYGNTRTALSVQITPSEAFFCQGRAIYRYRLDPDRNAVTLTPVKDDCPSQELTQAIRNSRYYRLRKGILNFYDEDVSLTMEMVYSEEYDPENPVFTESGAPPVPSVPTPPPAPSQPTPAPQPTSQAPKPISLSNLVGRWTINDLFRIPFPSTPYSILFTPQEIRLLGGCNGYSFQYELNSATQLITIGEENGSKRDCSASDDKLYVRGIRKMHKYLLSDSDSKHLLKFYDVDGEPTYTLEIEKSEPSPSSSSPAIPAPPKKVLPFESGNYLLLLLQRRDLPRKIIKVTANAMTYSGCNSIEHLYQLDDPKAIEGGISIRGGAVTEKACVDSTDDVYYQSLNLAKSYKFDEKVGVIILSNAAGIETVTLSRA